LAGVKHNQAIKQTSIPVLDFVLAAYASTKQSPPLRLLIAALHVTMKYLLFLALLSPLSYAEIREIDLGDGLSLVLDEMDFDTATNTVTIDSDSKKYRVNGRYPFGTDFGNPQSILVSAVLKYEDKAYDLWDERTSKNLTSLPASSSLCNYDPKP